MNNLKTVILIIVIFIVGVSALYWLYQSQIATDTELLPNINTEETSDDVPLEPEPNIESVEEISSLPMENEFVPAIQPESGTNTFEISNIGVNIISPIALSIISSPAVVSGIANTLGNIVISIYDSSGILLGSESVSACLDYNGCGFEISINFNSPNSNTGTIRAESSEGTDIIQIAF